MYSELELLLGAVDKKATREDYRYAAVEQNVLDKRTASNRKLSFQHLRELYALDPQIPLFRFLRVLWEVEPAGRPLIALLCAFARDPLLRLTYTAILDTPEGEAVNTANFEQVLAKLTGNRFTAKVLRSTARNAASSWTQSGHLHGKRRKIRTRPNVTPGAVAMALFLGYLEGRRGQRLFETLWVNLLEIPKERVHLLARQAAYRSWLDYKRIAEVIEVRFPGHLTKEEEELTHESH